MSPVFLRRRCYSVCGDCLRHTLRPHDGERDGHLRVKTTHSKPEKGVAISGSEHGADWVPAGDAGTPMRVTSFGKAHSELRKALQMSGDFVLHSLRLTYGTRLGEISGDALMEAPKGAFECGGSSALCSPDTEGSGARSGTVHFPF